jgi:hypothetical protein
MGTYDPRTAYRSRPSNRLRRCLKSAGGHGWKVKRIRRRAQALRTKVWNVIRDLHRKTCSLLCANFNAIFLLPGRDRITDRQQGHQQIKAVRNLMTCTAVPRDVELMPTARCDRDACVGGLHHKDITHTLWGPTMWAPREPLWCGLRMERDIAGSRNVALRCLTPVWRFEAPRPVTGHGR